MAEEATQFEFKAEVQRVLGLVINSLYTNAEVFLRELVSNASDALDKARFLNLTARDEMLEGEGEPAIDIFLDNDKRTLTVEDNGVGMTREEVIENLGTIAKSGTNEFLARFAELTKSAEKDRALELIGQFGVGFYSVFMVAQRVEVQTLSMKKGAEAVLWRSSGEGSFHVLPGDRTTPGTRVTLHLKEEAFEFARRWRVEGIIKKYSDFVMFPIRIDGEVVNQSRALWRMPRSAVTAEQYGELFKHITAGRWGAEPLAVAHWSVDAPVQFSALLFVPEAAPSDLFVFQRERPGLRLYARRVLIMENCELLTPAYLRFVRGVVDSEDLPLNVSRETLQDDRKIKVIEQQIVKQVLKELERVAQDEPERYAKLWKAFGAVIKEGVSIDFKNKDAIAGLCRFETLRSDAGKLSSLKEYVERKPIEQKSEIYYLTGTSRTQLEKSPHLEVFRKKGFDVLLMTDPIDEWVVKSLGRFDGHELRSVAHGDLDLGDVEPPAEDGGSIDRVVAAVKKALADEVEDVRASRRLTETAACLVAQEGDPGANLERIMKILDDHARERKRILELNPGHALLKNLAALVAADETDARIALWSRLLYDLALLGEGSVADPAALVDRLQQVLVEASAGLVRR
jgi:molecular chaperone HtpG